MPQPWSFADLLKQDPEHPAFHCKGESATRAELARAGARAAAWMAALGVRRGDAVALWLPDGGAWLQWLFGAAHLGALVVPISTRYRLEEAQHVVKTARATVLVVTPEFLGFDYRAAAHAIQRELPHVAHVIEIDRPQALFEVDPELPDVPAGGRAEDPLCTFSTSGTTGRPKLAVHDQRGIFLHSRNVVVRTEIRPGDVMLCVLSLYGVLGFVKALGALAGAASCVFMQVFKADDAAALIERHGVTHCYAADGVFAPILQVRGRSLATWRRGGFAEFAGLGASVIEQAEREWQLPLVAIYGSSEAFALAATELSTDPPAQRLVAGGLPLAPELGYRVVDVDSGAVLPDGQRGELQLRGYNVMTGYLNNPEATAAALTPDGWFRTGDLGYGAGERYVYLARLKDGLRLSGYLVEPNEIEEHLARHDAIIDAQVVGVNRVGKGDMAVAFVRCRPGGEGAATLTEAGLQAWCKAGMAGYKVPSRIIFVEDYPRVDGPNGTKILKNKLREMAELSVGAHT
jgi:fatty-acyl-CoA synthase